MLLAEFWPLLLIVSRTVAKSQPRVTTVSKRHETHARVGGIEPKMSHFASIATPFPSATQLAAATSSHKQRNFRISTRKLPISKSGAIEDLSQAIGIPVPEMIFGDNVVEIAHLPTGWTLRFDARDALDAVDKTDRNMLQVAYARDWSSSRERTSAGIKEVVKPYDWSYSTTYCGTLAVGGSGGNNSRSDGKGNAPGSSGASTSLSSGVDGSGDGDGDGAVATDPRYSFAPAPDRPIPLELLKRRDPILFFDDVMLYESELDDNGISVFSVKLRVHEHRMLLLCRLFMRLDNVIMRIRDTRVYIDFETEEVIREYTAKEDAFANVKNVFIPSSSPSPSPLSRLSLTDTHGLPPLPAPRSPCLHRRHENENSSFLTPLGPTHVGQATGRRDSRAEGPQHRRQLSYDQRTAPGGRLARSLTVDQLPWRLRAWGICRLWIESGYRGTRMDGD